MLTKRSILFILVLLSLFQSACFAEMGGANLSIDIRANETSLKIIRIFQEPGLPKESKSYKINKSDKSFIVNNEILLVSAKSEILLLEKKSGSFSIPTDIWVLYTKK